MRCDYDLSEAKELVRKFNEEKYISEDIVNDQAVLFGIRTNGVARKNRDGTEEWVTGHPSYYIVHRDVATGINLGKSYCNISSVRLKRGTLVVKVGFRKYRFPLSERADPRPEQGQADYSALDPLTFVTGAKTILLSKIAASQDAGEIGRLACAAAKVMEAEDILNKSK